MNEPRHRDMLTFGELIDDLRREHRIGVRELSRMTGLSSSHIHYLIRDRSRPRRATINKLARALEVRPDWLRDQLSDRRRQMRLMDEGVPREMAYYIAHLGPLTETQVRKATEPLARIWRTA